jgi:predicted DNA-binding protein
VAKKDEPKEQIAIRLERATLKRLDALAQKLERPGESLTRADALRMALARGIEVLEADKGK